MKYSTFNSISALALALVTSAGVATVAGAQTRTAQQQQAAVCRDGTQVSEVRLCNFRGGVDAQATQELRTYGTYGTRNGRTTNGQTRQNGSWKVNGQDNGSWKVNGQTNGQTTRRGDGRYDSRDDGQYGQRDGRYDNRDGRYDSRDGRYDSRDGRYDSRDDHDNGRRKHGNNGKHKGQYKHHDRDDDRDNDRD